MRGACCMIMDGCPQDGRSRRLMAFLFVKAARQITCHEQPKTSLNVASLWFVGFFVSFSCLFHFFFLKLYYFSPFSFYSANENLTYLSFNLLGLVPRLVTDLACAFLSTRASNHPIDSSAEQCRIKRDQEAFVDCSPLHRFTSGLLLCQSSFFDS